MRSPIPPPPKVVGFDVSEPSTDYLLEMVTDEWRYTTLEVRVRSTDPNSAILFRFETDDGPRPFGILRILPVNGTFSPGNVDYPYRHDSALGVAHVTGPTYPISETFTPLSVGLTELPVPCYQVRSLRVVGSVEMEYLRLRVGDRWPPAALCPFQVTRLMIAATQAIISAELQTKSLLVPLKPNIMYFIRS